MKEIIKAIVPPILFDFLKKLYNLRFGWTGDYLTWQEAQEKSSGYDSNIILEKVKNATIKVINREYKYERDGVNFNETDLPWPLFTILLKLSKEHDNLKVCDFGGSLGSTFYQLDSFCEIKQLKKWLIIEQAHFVNTGKEITKNKKLEFTSNLDDINQSFQVLILSSVLQYLEKPYDLIRDLLKKNFRYVIIDRTPIMNSNLKDEFIIIQEVPNELYSANYPSWILNKSKLENIFSQYNYELRNTFSSFDPGNKVYDFKGFYFEKVTS